MHHQKAHRRFNRTSSHRKAMLQSLANSLIQHEQIATTEEKAKDLRGFVEPLITRAKTANLANRRLIFSRLRNRDSVEKLFSELGPHFSKRPGGYTSVFKTYFRQGDGASMAVIKLVERDEKIQEHKAIFQKSVDEVEA